MEDGAGLSRLIAVQRNEKTEHAIYTRYSEITKDPQNRKVLLRLAEDELRHHDLWQRRTGKEVQPDRLKVWFYCMVSLIFGLSFGMKLMEKDGARSKVVVRKAEVWLGAENLAVDGDEHERELLRLINEDRLNYIGAIVLGLNDALVELTGALAGFTFAMQSSRLIATAGLITGIAAALSMGSTGYLTAKAEEGNRTPLKFALYTGLTYVFTVLLLILPYLVLSNIYFSLGLTLLIATVIILAFNFFVSVVKEVSFWDKSREMALLSLGIAAVSFGIGFLVRYLIGAEA